MKSKYLTVTNSALMILLSLFLFSCTSRYKLDLYLFSEHGKTRIKIKESEFIKNSELNLPSEVIKTRSGNGNCLIVVAGSNIKQSDSDEQSALTFDDYISYKLFIQLPSDVKVGNIPLLNNAYLNQLGRYDLDPTVKLFFPTSGFLVIDSVTNKNLFAGIEADFFNEKSNTKISFMGKFKTEFKR